MRVSPRGFTYIAMLATTLCAGTAYSQQNRSSSPQEIYAKCKPAVAMIYTFDSQKAPLEQGSGFIVSKDHIVTNYHVLAGSSSGSIVFSDGTVAMIESVTAASIPGDIAIVRAATGDRQPLQLGDESQVKVGQTVYAIGAPNGLSASLSDGLVSAFREEEGQFRIQITAQVAPGSSGGPLLDDRGLVIGITTSKLTDGGFGFAVGVSDIQHLLKMPLPIPVSLADLTEDNHTAPAQDGLETASALFSQNKYAEAFSALEKSSPEARAGFDGQLLLCRISEEMKDYANAVAACNSASSLQPGDGRPYGYEAFAQLASGDLREAESNALKATQLDHDGIFDDLLGTIYYSEAKYSLVLQHLSANSKDAFALTVLAGAALRTGDIATFRALSSKISALKSSPGGWQLYLDGVAAEKDLKFDSALNDFHACDSDDDFIDPICLISAAMVEAQQGNYDAAKSDISTAIAQHPSDHMALSEGIFIDLVTGNQQEAMRLHEQLAALSREQQDDADDCMYFYAINQASVAESYCASSISSSPESNTTWSNAGYVALDEGQYAQAAHDFSKAKSLYDASTDKHTVTEELDLDWGIAITLYYSGDRKDAKKLYRAIKHDYPDFATLSGLKQLPLIWSDTTQTLITQMVEGLR